ncbi:hypothetical protein L7F22_058196 [Adiantum nelumboides]|nr:hypothetical protein [Adiantum nelumboides]
MYATLDEAIRPLHDTSINEGSMPMDEASQPTEGEEKTMEETMEDKTVDEEQRTMGETVNKDDVKKNDYDDGAKAEDSNNDNKTTNPQSGPLLPVDLVVPVIFIQIDFDLGRRDTEAALFKAFARSLRRRTAERAQRRAHKFKRSRREDEDLTDASKKFKLVRDVSTRVKHGYHKQKMTEIEFDTDNGTEESDHSRWKMGIGRASRRKEKPVGHRSRTPDGHYNRDIGPYLKIACPIFKGKKHDDPDVHIQAFEQYAELKHILEEEWGEYFPHTLKEATRKWYYHYPDSKLQAYRKLKKAFILEYTNDKGDEDILYDRIKQYYLCRNSECNELQSLRDEPVDAELFQTTVVAVEELDPKWMEVHEFLQSGKIPKDWSNSRKKGLIVKSLKFTLIGGSLYRLGIDGVLRRCVPISARMQIIIEANTESSGGHFSSDIIYKKILQVGLWWKSIMAYVRTYCRTCDICQRMGRPTAANTTPLTIIQPLEVFMKWGIDFMGPVKKKTPRKNRVTSPSRLQTFTQVLVNEVVVSYLGDLDNKSDDDENEDDDDDKDDKDNEEPAGTLGSQGPTNNDNDDIDLPGTGPSS